MKVVIAGVASAIVMTGVAGSVAAYRLQAGDVAEAEPAAVSRDPQVEAAEPAAPRVKVRWAPCAEGSTLEEGVCVTDVTRTVVLPAPASAPTPRPPAAVARDDDDRDAWRDDEGSESGDDHEDDEGDDDHGDDDEGDDDHGDDDESGEDDDD